MPGSTGNNSSTLSISTSVTASHRGSIHGSGGVTLKLAARIAVAWLATFGAVLSIVGGALIATGSVASAATYAPQDCTFNGVSSTLSPTHLGIINVSAGNSVSISCSNLITSDLGAAVVAGQGSSLIMIAQCGGQACSSSSSPTQATLAENEADLNAGVDEACFPGCSSTWSTKYTVPNSWAAGGSAAGGFVTAPGDSNAHCPVTQQQADIGLPGCALSVADTNGDIWGLVLTNYGGSPTPQPPAVQLSSTSIAPGGKVTISDKPCTPSSSTTCPYFWGDPITSVPNSGGADPGLGNVSLPAVPLDIELCPTGGGSCTSISNPSTSPTVTVQKAIYNCTSASNNGISCSMKQYPTLSGSFTVPSSVSPGTYNVNVYEANPLGFFKGNGTTCPSGTTSSISSTCIETTASLTVSSPSTSTVPAITSITPDSSPLTGGGTANIIGTNLSGASAVDFGSVSATNVKAVSSTLVTATIPAATSPGLVKVTVTASAGTSGASGFMYVSSNIPYTPVTPYRIADTRCSSTLKGSSYCTSLNLPSANQSLSSPPAGGSITVQAAGTGSGSDAVPSGAQSVVVTVTAIAGSTAKNGYLAVYPAGTNPPTASSLNYAPGMAIPNLVTATIGSGGAIDILSSSANVNIVVDVEGYYEPSSGSTTTKFTPLPLPIRVLDTRCSASPQPGFCAAEKLPSANQKIQAPSGGSYIKVQITGIGGSSGIPLTAVAVSLVVTAAGPSSGGYLTVFPAGSSTTPPETSNVNFHAKIASADSVTVGVGSSGAIYIYNSANTATDVVVDVNGYFSSSGYALTPTSPVRICDTRNLSPSDVASGVSGQCANSGTALDPASSSSDPLTVQVTGVAGIPSTAKVVVANITVVNTTGGGYLTAWAAGATEPTTSNINWGKGQIMPNMVLSALNSKGQIEIDASSPANVIIDVVGWYS
ncbi:MAG: IPT/TIG domain-containing protein [Acidimicrobiales bacterium]